MISKKAIKILLSEYKKASGFNSFIIFRFWNEILFFIFWLLLISFLKKSKLEFFNNWKLSFEDEVVFYYFVFVVGFFLVSVGFWVWQLWVKKLKTENQELQKIIKEQKVESQSCLNKLNLIKSVLD